MRKFISLEEANASGLQITRISSGGLGELSLGAICKEDDRCYVLVSVGDGLQTYDAINYPQYSEAPIYYSAPYFDFAVESGATIHLWYDVQEFSPVAKADEVYTPEEFASRFEFIYKNEKLQNWVLKVFPESSTEHDFYSGETLAAAVR